MVLSARSKKLLCQLAVTVKLETQLVERESRCLPIRTRLQSATLMPFRPCSRPEQSCRGRKRRSRRRKQRDHRMVGRWLACWPEQSMYCDSVNGQVSGQEVELGGHTSKWQRPSQSWSVSKTSSPNGLRHGSFEAEASRFAIHFSCDPWRELLFEEILRNAFEKAWRM